MSIKLDWEIEAEQSQMRSEGEDRETARRRRLARIRLLLFVAVVVIIMGGIAAVVLLRLQQVDAEIHQMLIDTVDAEVASLRIGDRTAFLNIQRSASEDWLLQQEALFDEYQRLKTDSDVRLTGRAVEATVDNTRGRVQVEEILDGVPYARLWFYWRYEDGWRHVPPDYTFWGEVDVVDRARVAIRYREVDAVLAEAMADPLQGWLESTCAVLTCDTLPALEIDIIPDPGLQLSWSPANPWLLQVPSPYIERTRLDIPFEDTLRLEIADLLAERLIIHVNGGSDPVYPADAVYLRQSVRAWFVQRFTGVPMSSLLIDSLTQNYGEGAVGRLLAALQPTSDISVLNQVTGSVSLAESNLDWRSFIGWRLTIEQEIINQRDEANFLNLYDTGDETARNIGYGRFNANLPPESVIVLATAIEIDANGVAHVRSRVQFGSGDAVREEEVIFRLVNGVWRRAN